MEIDQLKKFLESKGISYESEESLQILADNQLAKIQSFTGRELVPVAHTDVELNYDSKTNSYNLKHYPVKEIIKVKIDNKIVHHNMYVLDKTNGKLQFLKKTKGTTLTIDYISQETDSFININIIPLIYDMIIYELDNSPTRNASSVKEGDLSINYDTTNSLYATIIQRLENLKTRKGILTRMI